MFEFVISSIVEVEVAVALVVVACALVAVLGPDRIVVVNGAREAVTGAAGARAEIVVLAPLGAALLTTGMLVWDASGGDVCTVPFLGVCGVVSISGAAARRPLRKLAWSTKKNAIVLRFLIVESFAFGSSGSV